MRARAAFASNRDLASAREAANALEAALRSRSPAQVERACDIGRRSGWHPLMASFLADLLVADWHREHETIARALQELAPAPAVGALERAALMSFDYLRHDGFFGLARTCTWALADIGTPEAREALTRLAQAARTQAAHALVASYAHERLERWDEERHRKRR